MVLSAKLSEPRLRCHWALPVLVWALCAATLQGQDTRPTEYQVKAAYLSNFGRFVEWPERFRAGTTFQICVLGQDPFGPALDAAVSGETIRGLPMAGRRIARPEDATGCRVLFISSSEERRLKETMAAIENTGILTVSDIPQFTRRGGMIQFVLEGNRVRFEVNLTASRNAGLAFSSEMVKLAVAVRR